jgi:uncharacterized membrane protein
MRVTGLGHVLFAVGLAGLGILSLISGDFALNWQPVPAWVPLREVLARVSGLVLLAGSLGMLLKRTALPSAIILTLNLLIWLLLLRFPRVAANPTSEGMWLGFGETLLLVTGGWSLVAAVTAPDDHPIITRVAGDEGVRVARLLFAISMPMIGLSHFVYVRETAALVPAWLPYRIGWAYLGGAGHVAAGIGVGFAIVPRLAATLEAVMIGIFTLLVWVPRVARLLRTSRFEWTAMLVSAAMAGAAGAVAGPLHGVPWRQPRTIPSVTGSWSAQ